MKYYLIMAGLISFSTPLTAQINIDSLTKELSNFFINEKGDTIWTKGKTSGRAVIVSVGGFDKVKRDTSSWEGRWQNYAERESLKVGDKVINRNDTAKIKYEVVLNFSFNEDGSITDLMVTCSPNDEFIKSEFRKLVFLAPKKPPVYRNGKFLRTHIKQPVSITTN